MPTEEDPDRWARLRFAIIGPLLAAPPPRGQLRKTIAALVNKDWVHPVDGTTIRFGFATLERWYYAAYKAKDPVAALRRQLREDAGRFRMLSAALIHELEMQYKAHTGWTVQLHYDNLAVLADEDLALHPMPSYSTLRRYMKARGYHRRRRPKRDTPGARQAEKRLQQLEVRSYEVEYVHGLWHTDFHHGSRQVLTTSGSWVKPLLLCIIDDHSRLICHLQWYLDESAEVLVHGLSQALQKRGLPRSLMTDNGSAMKADEFTSGLHALGILHDPTLPYSPYQNAKQETFWATLEGRLMAMLEDVKDLTLDRLNEVTQAWAEQEYHNHHHDEIKTTPLRRFLDAPQVGRDCPDSKTLRQVFRCTVKRKQRRSDGTISLDGKRFEIPNRYRHLEQPSVRYARWDLSAVELIDPRTFSSLGPLYPLDKTANAEGRRRALQPSQECSESAQNDKPVSKGELPPLLRKCLADYAATGRPPAYLPKPDSETDS
ncbi:MAG: transposase family protein [Chloroflexi bacterium]|nr:transposase family protein [Chloroflexota bacterium]